MRRTTILARGTVTCGGSPRQRRTRVMWGWKGRSSRQKPRARRSDWMDRARSSRARSARTLAHHRPSKWSRGPPTAREKGRQETDASAARAPSGAEVSPRKTSVRCRFSGGGKAPLPWRRRSAWADSRASCTDGESGMARKSRMEFSPFSYGFDCAPRLFGATIDPVCNRGKEFP